MKRPRLWPILLAAGLALAVLLALGTWQVQRLAWKEAMIARLTERLKGPSVSLAEAEMRHAAGEVLDFLPVELKGRFRHDHEMRVISTYEGGPGWEIVTPLLTSEGRVVLVNRGRVPDHASAAIDRPADERLILAIVRPGAGAQAYFDPPNDPAAGQWYWWDMSAMIAAAGLRPGETAAPFVLQELPTGPQTVFPRPQPPDLGLRNNHLGYAITWFGLAAVLVVIVAVFLGQQLRKPDA